MKSQAKVKQQRRIKNIPIFMHGFRMGGYMFHTLSETPSKQPVRARRRTQSRSRVINRGR